MHLLQVHKMDGTIDSLEIQTETNASAIKSANLYATSPEVDYVVVRDKNGLQVDCIDSCCPYQDFQSESEPTDEKFWDEQQEKELDQTRHWAGLNH